MTPMTPEEWAEARRDAAAEEFECDIESRISRLRRKHPDLSQGELRELALDEAYDDWQYNNCCRSFECPCGGWTG